MKRTLLLSSLGLHLYRISLADESSMFMQQLLCDKPDKSVLLPFSLVLHTPEVDLLFVEIIRSDSKLPAVLINHPSQSG